MDCFLIENVFPYPDKKKNNPTPTSVNTQEINFIIEMLDCLEKYNILVKCDANIANIAKPLILVVKSLFKKLSLIGFTLIFFIEIKNTNI